MYCPSLMVEDFNEIDWEDEEEEILLGDVVICLEQAQRQAEEYGHSQMRMRADLSVRAQRAAPSGIRSYGRVEDKVQMRSREEEAHHGCFRFEK